MELSDYDILGVTNDSSYRVIKNAYHELARIYHPDSIIIIKSLTKEERILSFKKIQEAFSNIKKKLNITEIDLPKCEIEYSDDIFIKNNENIKDLESFNKEFNKVHPKQCIDEPYSIHYKLENKDKNQNDNKLILKQREYHNNLYEFGINNVSDYSGEYYTDTRNEY